MGTLIHFPPRREDAVAKTEAILMKIGQLYQQKLKAKEELPTVLARLVALGSSDLALRALVLWGSGEMEPHEVLAMVSDEAARMGIHLSEE